MVGLEGGVFGHECELEESGVDSDVLVSSLFSFSPGKGVEGRKFGLICGG